MSDIHNQREIDSLQSEIDRLRAENERLQRLLLTLDDQRWRIALAALEVTNDRAHSSEGRS